MDINQVNARLRLHYGSNLVGLPFFRLVFSDRQLEKRFGVYQEFYGKIFLREFVGVREVPKYNYLKGKWVLERWIPPAYAYTPDIPDSSEGSYEPIYVFQDAAGNALPVVEEFVDKVIDTILHPQLPGHRAALLRSEEETALNKEIEFNKMVLEDQGRSWIGHRLHSKEAVIKL